MLFFVPVYSFAQEFDNLCGTESYEEEETQSTSPLIPPTICMKYLQVNVTFIQDGSGGGNFTATGNNSPSLPTNYTGFDFANDLVNRMNEYLADNIPMNACNGWLYYDPNANVDFLTPNLTPPVDWALPATAPNVPFRFVLSGVHFISNQTYFNNTNAGSLIDLLNADASLNIPNEIEIFAHPNPPPVPGLPWGVAKNKQVLVLDVGDRLGCNTFISHLTLHELGHVLNLKHSFVKYVCTSTTAACNSCPYFDDTHNVCDLPYNLTSSTTDLNTSCSSPINLTNQFSDNLTSTPATAPCGSGLWLTLPPTVPYWRWQPCNEPEEIDNNTMNYLCGFPFAHAFTQEQINIMSNYLFTNLSAYVIASDEIFPPVTINGQYQINYFPTTCQEENIPEECLNAGGNILTAANNAWEQPVTYQWSTGSDAAQITVSEAGTYSVTVTTGNGCTGSANVLVLPAPTATLPEQVDICSYELPYVLSATDIPGATYSWAIDGELQTENSNAISITTSGVYSVTATNNSGCSAYASATVSIYNSPEAAIIPSNSTTICTGQSATLTASGGGTYQWSNGATGNIITVTPATSTTYTVTVTDTNGCTATDAITVTVNALPTANAGADQSICTGQSATLTATGGYTYQWNNGANTATTTISPTATTTYTVTVTDANGCTATDNVTVTVNPLPDMPVINNLLPQYCLADIVQLNLTPPNGQLTAIDPNGNDAVLIDPYTFIVSEEGVYTLIYTVTNAVGCTTTATATTTVALCCPPPPDDTPNVIDTPQELACCLQSADFLIDQNTNGLGMVYDNKSYTVQNSGTWSLGSNELETAFGPATGGILRINTDIIIPAGIGITLQGITFEFGPKGRIIVQRGGTLQFGGSLNVPVMLRGLCNSVWQGIQVEGPGWGNERQAAPTVNYGMVTSLPNTNYTIEDAIIAVAGMRLPLIDVNSIAYQIENALTLYFYNGGNADFMPNLTAVFLKTYTNSTTAQSTSGGICHLVDQGGSLQGNFQGLNLSWFDNLKNEPGSVPFTSQCQHTNFSGGSLPYPFNTSPLSPDVLLSEVGIYSEEYRYLTVYNNNYFFRLKYGVRTFECKLFKIGSPAINGGNSFNNCNVGISLSNSILSTSPTEAIGIYYNMLTGNRVGIQCAGSSVYVTGNTITGSGAYYTDAGGTITGVQTGMFMQGADFTVKYNNISYVLVGIGLLNNNQDIDLPH